MLGAYNSIALIADFRKKFTQSKMSSRFGKKKKKLVTYSGDKFGMFELGMNSCANGRIYEIAGTASSRSC